MKRVITLLLTVVFICSLCACGGTSSSSSSSENSNSAATQDTADAAAETNSDDFPAITLNYSNCRPENHNFNEFDSWLFEELLNRANITIVPYYSNTLVGSTTPYAEVKDGIADIAWINAGTESDHFDIAANIMYFMWGCSDVEILRDAWWDVFDEMDEWNEQYEGVEVLMLSSAGTVYVTSIDEIATIDDFKGLVLRGAASQTSLLSALGAENLSVSSPEVLANMEKGTLDGALGADAIVSYSLYEYCNYTVCTGMCDAYTPQIIMNEDSWNKLTSQQQDVVKELYKELSDKIVSSWDTWNSEAIDFGISEGITLTVFSDEDLAAIQAVGYELAMQGIEDLNALGYDGQTMYDLCRSALEARCADTGYEITSVA